MRASRGPSPYCFLLERMKWYSFGQSVGGDYGPSRMDLSTSSRNAAEIAALRQLSLAQLLLNRRNALIVNCSKSGCRQLEVRGAGFD